MIEKIGFVLCLLGFGGMAEAYGFNKSFAISLTLIIVGAILIGIGDMSNDIKTMGIVVQIITKGLANKTLS